MLHDHNLKRKITLGLTFLFVNFWVVIHFPFSLSLSLSDSLWLSLFLPSVMVWVIALFFVLFCCFFFLMSPLFPLFQCGMILSIHLKFHSLNSSQISLNYRHRTLPKMFLFRMQSRGFYRVPTQMGNGQILIPASHSTQSF